MVSSATIAAQQPEWYGHVSAYVTALFDNDPTTGDLMTHMYDVVKPHPQRLRDAYRIAVGLTDAESRVSYSSMIVVTCTV